MSSTTVTIDDGEVRQLLRDLIKRSGQISKRAKEFVGILSAVVLRDVVDHFAREEGPDGGWVPWSNAYRKHMIAIGKGGNLILSDTGHLKGGWQPARYRASRDGILWFNPVEYAAKHDQGIEPFPQRRFTWLSKRAIRDIEGQTAAFLENG